MSSTLSKTRASTEHPQWRKGLPRCGHIVLRVDETKILAEELCMTGRCWVLSMQIVKPFPEGVCPGTCTSYSEFPPNDSN